MATKKPEEPQVLPPLEDGEIVDVVQVRVVDRATRPPSPYTEGTLLDDMIAAGKFVQDDPALRRILKEVSGLGTSATRDSILEGLVRDRYLERKGKTLRATPKGLAFIDWIEAVEPQLTDVAVTARWEAELAVIAKKGGGPDFEKRIAQFVEGLVSKLKGAAPMRLASSLPPTSKESSRMSESDGSPGTSSGNPPTSKMVDFARSIAKRLGQELPPDVETSFDACKAFLDTNSPAAMAPSPAQLKYATNIAERKSLTIPADTLKNGKELSKWIDANK